MDVGTLIQNILETIQSKVSTVVNDTPIIIGGIDQSYPSYKDLILIDYSTPTDISIVNTTALSYAVDFDVLLLSSSPLVMAEELRLMSLLDTIQQSIIVHYLSDDNSLVREIIPTSFGRTVVESESKSNMYGIGTTIRIVFTYQLAL